MYIINNRKLFSWLLILLIPLGLYSCKKSFLDIPSTSSVDAEEAITDLSGMETAINGIYDQLQSSDYYNRSFSVIPELMSDNLYLSTKNAGRYLDYNDYIVTKMNGYASDMWDVVYRVIVNCNLIINAAPNVDAAEEDKDAILGQAYALRALAHFDLCRAFAQPYNFTSDASHPGIPIVVNSSISLPEKVEKPSRNTVKEVYDQIIDDFETAISLLPESLPGEKATFSGKVNKYAAEALLSRVYLYKGDWKESKSLADDVINSKVYSLLPNTDLVSNFSSSNNGETILEVFNTDQDNSGTSSLGAFYGQNNSYGDALATYDLYDIFSATDVRKSFMKIGDRNANGSEKNVPLILKYGTDPTNAENVKIIRLAEVYINRAEAEAHIPGQEANAIADLSEVAERADPIMTINPSLKGQQLIDRILLERRKELAFEGQRLFDLIRNKKDFVKYESEDNTMNITYPSEKTILPIPQAEIDVNGDLEQNPGY